MKCTHSELPRKSQLAYATLLATGLTVSMPAAAEQVSIQFSQTFPGGGSVTGLLVGEDLDGDGRLYAVAPLLADFIQQPAASGEVSYASVRIEDVLGQTVRVVFDASLADLDDPALGFFGFAYNLDGGPIGDEENEGISLAPLAPSTSYTAGALFGAIITGSIISEPVGVCGNADGTPCSTIFTLDPVDPFPNFDLLFAATSQAPIPTYELLRYTFEQSGFDGGASVTGTISGRDIDGDGRIYATGQYMRDALGLAGGDEVAYVTTTIVGVDPTPIVNTVDLTAGDVLDVENFFFGADISVAGDQLGDEGTEALSVAPFSPSTSYVVGEAFSEAFAPVVVEQGLLNCGNEAEAPCGLLLSLTPNPDVSTGVDVKAAQYSAEPVAQTADPFIVDSSFGGYWFNVIPSREGLVIQEIRDGRYLTSWMTYDADGAQRWILAIGEREGLQIVADEVFVTENGVFASLEEIEPDVIDVGEVTIVFSDCDNGEVRYTIDGESGVMEIGRMTGLGSDECTR
jgi:hypothetical protein